MISSTRKLGVVVYLLGVILVGCGSGDLVGADSSADLAEGLNDILTDQGNPVDAQITDQGNPVDLPVAKDKVGADVGDSQTGSDTGGPVAMPEDAGVVFLHHSTGGVIFNGGVEQSVELYNAAHGTSYSIKAPNHPCPK